MKVLIVCDVLGEENNGTTIAATNLINYLKSQGDEVRILCADQDKKGQENVYVVPNIYLGLLINYLLKKNNVNLAKPVKKIIKEALKGVDVVHVVIPFALGNKTAKIARKMGIPVTASFHCQAENFTAHVFNTIDSKLVNKIVYKTFYKKLYKRVNAIHYPTEFIKDVFETTVKRKSNAYVISNGVNNRYKKLDIVRSVEFENKFNILFIGRLSKEKSHDLLLKAVSLSKYKDQLQLYFAGQGPRLKQILLLSKKLKINTPIIKFYSRDDLVKLINSCDLYVHPSKIEIEAISCLEAISCGLVPVISSSKRSATNKFALSEKNLFKYDSPQDLANKIDYWIEHPVEKQECAKQYLENLKPFDQEECMKKMRNMLLTYSKEENHTPKTTYYYEDELNDDFAFNGIVANKTPAKYKYLHKNPIYKFFEFILYWIIAKPVVLLINKIAYKQKFENHLTCKKSELKGCFIYANHTLGMGDAYTPNLIFGEKNNVIVGPEATSVFGIKTIVGMLGGMPLPSTLKGFKNFLNAIEKKTSKGQHITIYPEAHIWPYYTGIRNFKSASFKYPVDLDKPVICLTNTFVPYKKSFRLVTHIDGPFYPNLTIDKKDAVELLRNDVYQTMKKRSNEVKQFEKIKYIKIEKRQ